MGVLIERTPFGNGLLITSVEANTDYKTRSTKGYNDQSKNLHLL
jgi:hypothetical protein